jgi:hypothetical protein
MTPHIPNSVSAWCSQVCNTAPPRNPHNGDDENDNTRKKRTQTASRRSLKNRTKEREPARAFSRILSARFEWRLARDEEAHSPRDLVRGAAEPLWP